MEQCSLHLVSITPESVDKYEDINRDQLMPFLALYTLEYM